MTELAEHRPREETLGEQTSYQVLLNSHDDPVSIRDLVVCSTPHNTSEKHHHIAWNNEELDDSVGAAVVGA